uniref:Uncharacterized protein n=1 Tax=Anguilla anguilla TaxID=7936 RepID=A0A0E9TM44_ANGAN
MWLCVTTSNFATKKWTWAIAFKGQCEAK